MSRQSEILNSTLEAVNKNNAITVSFSNREKIIIKNMMEQYATEVAQASLEKASENACMIEITEVEHWIDKESITNSENIVLL